MKEAAKVRKEAEKKRKVRCLQTGLIDMSTISGNTLVNYGFHGRFELVGFSSRK